MASDNNLLKNMNLKPEDFQKVGVDEKEAEVIQRESLSAWKDSWQRLRQNKMAMTALGILGLIVLAAIIAPLFSKYNYYSNDLMNTNKPLPPITGLERMILDVIFSFVLGTAHGSP